MTLAVFVSGNGSNLQSLLDAAAGGVIPRVALVVGNVPCKGLERANAAGIDARLIPHGSFPSREAFDAALVQAVRGAGADLVCLAGFMRVLSSTFLEPFAGRVLNIHPSLLPAFPGLHAQRQALEAGVRVAGCTVHFVDPGVDTGPILAQAAVPVLPTDTEETLGARILAQEHRLFPAAVAWLATGAVRQEGHRAVFAALPSPTFDAAQHLTSPGLTTP